VQTISIQKIVFLSTLFVTFFSAILFQFIIITNCVTLFHQTFYKTLMNWVFRKAYTNIQIHQDFRKIFPLLPLQLRKQKRLNFEEETPQNSAFKRPAKFLDKDFIVSQTFSFF